MWKFPFRLRGMKLESTNCRFEEIEEGEGDTIPMVTPKTVSSKKETTRVSQLKGNNVVSLK